MNRVRWDRVLAVSAILSFPLVYSWLKRHLEVGRFNGYRLFAPIAANAEARELVLLAVILLGTVLLLKALRG